MQENKIVVYRMLETDGVGISFLQYRDGKKFIAKPIKLEFIEVAMDCRVESTLYLSSEYAEEVANGLDKLDIKTDRNSKIEGTLDATKYHLEDLRKMLKLKE